MLSDHFLFRYVLPDSRFDFAADEGEVCILSKMSVHSKCSTFCHVGSLVPGVERLTYFRRFLFVSE